MLPAAYGRAADRSLAEVLESQLQIAEKRILGAAEAMPESDYGFVPGPGEFEGVRTFGEQVKHSAAAIYTIFAGVRGEKPPAHVNDGKGPEEVRTKGQIVQYLKDSFGYARGANALLNTSNMLEIAAPGSFSRLDFAILGPVHTLDHYGQVVVYLRMKRIVPPVTQEEIRRQGEARKE